MGIDYQTWREVAFSHGQIQDFLSIVALPHYEVKKFMPVESSLFRCFCTGFYFFCQSIREQLAPALSEALFNLAIRVERCATESVWDQNAEEARQLLAHYYESDGKTGA